jgi:nitrous oxide reductase accessory protein NosL
MKRFALALLIALIAASPAWAAERKPVKPAARDKCPVCGMFVAKYPDFVAQVTFQDGSYAVFDGAKDMFKYFLDLKKYAPAKRVEDIASIYVTDYYSLEPIDGFTAWYATGSDVYGPMGKELIPFAKESDARGFMKDHKGKALLQFKAVNAEVIRGLD